MPEINVSNACILCGVCTKVCPMSIFTLSVAQNKACPDHTNACIRCGHCLANCPVDAITVAGVHLECDVSSEKPCTYDSIRGMVRRRRSVRVFLEKTIPKSDIDELLATARFAPTARNSQNVHWTVVMDPHKVQTLSGLAIDWFRERKIMDMVKLWEAGYDIINHHAPHLVVTHSDETTAKPVEDAAIALTTFEMLANANGFGTCWAGFFMTAAYDYAPLHRGLELPLGHKVRGALMLGYAGVTPQKVPGRDPAKVRFI